MKPKCISCGAGMRAVQISYRGIQLAGLECLKCRERIFTEKQSISAIKKVQAVQLKKEYSRNIIKIGKSIGMTFPKDIADFFLLNKNKKLKIKPDIEQNKIEISI